MPTGTTPRKRTWEFNDRWDLMGNRESILENWRQQKPSCSSPLSGIISEEAPFPSQEVYSETESNSRGHVEEDVESIAEDPDETVTQDSSELPSPLNSSLSSVASAPKHTTPELKKPILRRRTGIPTKGTLTERSTNVMAGRPSRRTIR